MTFRTTEDVFSKYALQTCNLFSFIDKNLLMKFSDQLTDDEYLLFDYMVYQGCNISEAAKKIEFGFNKTYRLLGNIKCKGLLFFTSNQGIFFSKDRMLISSDSPCALPAHIQNSLEQTALSA
mgnify:FL=1